MGDEIPTVNKSDESRPTVALRANNPRQKARWERAVEESGEYANVSHLIKTAVERELSDSYTTDTASDSGGVSDSDMRKVFDRLDTLQADVSGLSDGLESVRTAVHTTDTTLPEETTTAVYAAIPNGPAAATTAVGIAEGTDVSPETAEIACGQLATNHPAVEMIEFQELDIDRDTHTAQWNNREIEIEAGSEAVKRQNPLYYKEV